MLHIGLFFVDIVTLSHVLEPRLCGLDAVYLDLGGLYDSEALAQNRGELEAAKRKNAACYPLCTLALQSAAAASDGLHKIAAAALPPAVLQEAKGRLLPPLLPARRGPGTVLRRFVTAISPKGLLSLPLPVSRVFVFRDSYRLSAALLGQICADYKAAGHLVVCGFDPLHPEQASAVLVPELDVGYCASSRLFPLADGTAPWLDLDALVSEHLSYERQQQLEAFEQLRAAGLQQAITHLREAKRHHDALEAACRPAVDFTRLDEQIEAILTTLEG